MKTIKFGVLNATENPKSWTNLSNFQNLDEFCCGQMYKNGSKDINSVYDIQWPNRLKTVEIGMNITQESRVRLPCSVIHLRLCGEHFRNAHLNDVIVELCSFFYLK